jgi:bacteriorhodopsin
MMIVTQVLAAGPQGPTTELTGTSEFSRWQYELILYGFVVAFFALFAAGVYGIATRNEVSKKYRPAAMASTLICWIASLAYLALVVTWLTKFTSNADGTRYAPAPGTIVTGLRYADWTVTVPLLTVELLAVCVVARDKVRNLRFTTMAAGFLMIITGLFGVLAVGQSSASVAELLIWGTVSTVFFVALYPLLLRPVAATRAVIGVEAGTSLRNAAVLLLAVFGVYPIVFLIPLWAGDNSPGWATTIQLAFTAADIAAKVGFGIIIHKVAKLRTAEDAATAAALVSEEYPAEVWISGELISLPGHPTPELTGATGLTTGAPTTGAGEHERR